MKKEQTLVKITEKNRKKVKETLEMFGEELYGDKTLQCNYIVLLIFSRKWIGVDDPLDYELIKPKQLKELLAKEHLKEGDVVVAKTEFGFNTTVKVTYIRDSFFTGVNNYLIGNFNFKYKDFIRYATEEEKEFLDPKQTNLESKVKLEEYSPVSRFEKHGIEIIDVPFETPSEFSEGLIMFQNELSKHGYKITFNIDKL